MIGFDMNGRRIREGMRVTSADTLGEGIVTDTGALGETHRVRVLWTHGMYGEFGIVQWRDTDSVCATADRYGNALPERG